MDIKQRKAVSKKIYRTIIELQGIQKLLSNKRTHYFFLFDTIGNAGYALTNMLIYLEEKHPYYDRFDLDAYKNIQAAMHRTFFSDLHISTEWGLRQIIENKQYSLSINKMQQAYSIIDHIDKQSPKIKDLIKVYSKIKRLAGNRPTFNDYLNTVLKNTKELDKEYIKTCREYFDAMSIIRNKVAHSDMNLDELEKIKLIKGKMGKAIDNNGNLQMTFEGYKLLITDIVRFFDNIYTHL